MSIDHAATAAEAEAERDALLALLDPFPADHVGKLPRVICTDCSRGRCDDHRKTRCAECQAYVSTKHIHLDYVGHADVTRRLLETDPMWDWAPLAEDHNGLPIFDTDAKGNPVGLWIKLTVLGVTRRGYGSCPANQNDAVKVLIGDALRNAAMRFGVALDLWAKGDRADPADQNAVAAGGQAAQRNTPPPPDPATPPPPAQQHTNHAWLTSMETRIGQATSRAELTELAREISARKQGGGCEPTHEQHLWTLGRTRQEILDNGRPVNKDGSTSRSRSTDEELAARGEMTAEQRKAHNALERDALAESKKADRAYGPAAEDPWAITDAPADAGGGRG